MTFIIFHTFLKRSSAYAKKIYCDTKIASSVEVKMYFIYLVFSDKIYRKKVKF